MAGLPNPAYYLIPPATPHRPNGVLSAASDPTGEDGIDGDFWINTTTVTIFGPKEDGAWPVGIPLQGPQGPGGADHVTTEITATMHQGEINHRYIANHADTRVAITLPAIASIGNTVEIIGKGAGGWSLDQNAAQTIRIGDVATTPGPGGHIRSSAIFDCITVRCMTTNTEWIAISTIGNPSIL